MDTDLRPLFTVYCRAEGPGSVTLLMTVGVVESEIGEYDTIEEGMIALRAVRDAWVIFKLVLLHSDENHQAVSQPDDRNSL